MKNERYWLDIESGIIFDTENEKDFDPINKLNEQDQQISDLQKENEVLRMALRNAVINADFYKYGSQSTTDENIKRILRLEEQYIQQAKEQCDD